MTEMKWNQFDMLFIMSEWFSIILTPKFVYIPTLPFYVRRKKILTSGASIYILVSCEIKYEICCVFYSFEMKMVELNLVFYTYRVFKLLKLLAMFIVVIAKEEFLEKLLMYD